MDAEVNWLWFENAQGLGVEPDLIKLPETSLRRRHSAFDHAGIESFHSFGKTECFSFRHPGRVYPTGKNTAPVMALSP